MTSSLLGGIQTPPLPLVIMSWLNDVITFGGYPDPPPPPQVMTSFMNSPLIVFAQNIKTIRKLSRPSGKYPDYPETFQAIRKLSRLSGNFPDHPENIQPIRKLSRLSGNFPDHPENIQPTRKLSRLSGNFLYHPENIQPIRKLSKGSGNFPVQFQGLRAKTFRTRKNFPGGNATLPPRFLRLCSKALP